MPESFDRAQLTPGVLANDVASGKCLSGEQAQACARDARLLHLESLRVRLRSKGNRSQGKSERASERERKIKIKTNSSKGGEGHAYRY